jgi:transcriptional regulator with XRE-family HTH domain
VKKIDVRDLRGRLGLTQQQFAACLGLSTVSISRWEHDHTKPTGGTEILVALVERAVARHGPEHVVDKLQNLFRSNDIDRVVTLVYLGDGASP